MTGPTQKPRAMRTDWWEEQPMLYDAWGTAPLGHEPGTRGYFSEMDRRLVRAADFAQEAGQAPFASLIPYGALAGKRVLDLGCGAGAHTEMLARGGARVAACDLSRRAIGLSKARMGVSGLSGLLVRADARQLPFRSGAFDFVWSWGVIHHSPDTEACIREIARVLGPRGEARVMVYHRDSIGYWLHIVVFKGILLGRLAHRALDEVVADHSDGAVAGYWTRRGIQGVFRRSFDRVAVRVYGQRSEALPLPRWMRDALLRLVPRRLTRWGLGWVGAFLLVIARKGESPRR